MGIGVQNIEKLLLSSTNESRIQLANDIIESETCLKSLTSYFIQKDEKVCMRYLWLLTEVGQLKPDLLRNSLPHLVANWSQIKVKNKEASLANYWLIVGVPEESESVAIHWLFAWLNSSETNVTTKSRSLFVLENLAKKFPEIKGELKASLKDQGSRYSLDFQKRVEKSLMRIGDQ